MSRAQHALKDIANPRSTVGKVIAVILAMSLALMAWNASTLSFAIAGGAGDAVTEADYEANDKSADADEQKAPAKEEKAEKAEAAAEPAAAEEPAPAADEPAAEPADEPAGDEPEGDSGSDAYADVSEDSAASDDSAPESSTEAEPVDEGTDEGDQGAKEKKADEAYPAVTLHASAGGTSVTVQAPEGALPKDVKLHAADVTSRSIAEQIEDAAGIEVGDLKAIDVTFTKDGKEIQPKKAVKVTFSGANVEGDSIDVFHISDGGSVDQVASDVGAATQSFSASSFSVYVVVGEDDPSKDKNTTITYVFLDSDGSTFSTQTVKEGDTLSNPGTPAYDTSQNEEFHGWYLDEGHSEQLDFGTVGKIPKTIDEQKVYPYITTTYYVTFIGAAGEIAHVARVEADKGQSATLDVSGYDVTPTKDTQAFKGWTETEGGTTLVNNPVEVSGNMYLYPVIVDAYWIYFNENDGGTGGGASYTGPVSVEKGQVPSAVKPEDPTRKGYDFAGWYTDADCTSAFDWDTPITENKTLYAKWDAKADTTYTVIVWKQKVTDAKDAADASKTYDYEEGAVLNSTTGTTITQQMVRTYTQYSYTGFHYSRYEVVDGKGNATTTVGAKGDTVVNVYYDRNLNTINFYTGNRQTLDMSMTGLYGQTLSQNGYTWPTNRDWYEGNTHVTFLDGFMSSSTTTNLYGEQESSGSYTISHYKQNIDGSYPSTATNSTRSNGGSWNFTEKYDGFTVSEYRLGNSGSWSKTSAGNSVTYRQNLYIHYTRNNYSLSFSDDGEVVDTISSIPYEKPLASYEAQAPELPSRTGYHFDGWYEDAAGTVPFNWNSTMPASNKVIYSKWSPEVYQIHLDPNNGSLINGQIADFKVDYGDELSRTSLMTNVVREGYDLVGWFDADTGSAYSFGRVTKDTNLVAKWRWPGTVNIVYDAGEHGSNPPEDKYGYADGSSAVVGAPPTPETGYRFIGWQLNGTTYYPNNSFEINEDVISGGKVTLTALYEKLGEGSTETTSFKYDPNGGTGDVITVDKGKDGKDLRPNESVTALDEAGCGYTRDGYQLIGWSKDKGDDNEVLAELGQEFVAADNDGQPNVWYAVWAQKVEVVVTGSETEKAYTGSEQSSDPYTVTYKVGGQVVDTLPSGVTATVEASDVTSGATADTGAKVLKATEVGEYQATITATLTSTNPKYYVVEKTSSDTVKLTIKKAAVTVTITGNTATNVYNGQEQNVTGYTATADNDDYDLSKVAFSGTAEAKGTDVGEYAMDLTADMFSNTDDTYDVTFVIEQDGKLTITPLAVKVSITGNTATNDYDGQEHSAKGYEAKADNKLYDVSNVSYSGTAEASRTDVGKTDMGLNAEKFSNANDNFDVTFVVVSDGWQEITPVDIEVTIVGNTDKLAYNGMEQSAEGYEVAEISSSVYTEDDFEFTGEAKAAGTNVGTYAMGLDASQFKNKNANFKTVVFKVTDGSLEITPLAVKVTITGNTATETYDGTEKSATGYKAEADSDLYVEGNISFSGKAEASRTDVGTTEMGLQESQFANNNKNFTATFEVTDGWVKVEKAALTVKVTGNTDSLTYNGKEQSVTGFTTDAPEGVTVTYAPGEAKAAGTNVGDYDMGLKAEDFSAEAKNYDVTFEIAQDGKLTIEPVEVTVTADDKTKAYGDDDPELTATVKGLIGSDTVAYELERDAGEDVGKYAITLSGDAEQGNYKVVFNNGTLTITKAPASKLGLTVTDYTGTYDAAEHTVSASATVKDAALSYSTDGKTWTDTPPTWTDAGKARTVQVKAESDNYETATDSGTVTINPVKLTVTTQGATKMYDGTALANDEATVDGLVAGETVSVSATGSRTDAGSSDNGYALTWDGTAKAGNYTVSTVNLGKLRVTKRSVTLTSADATKAYDGSALTSHLVSASGDGFVEGEGVTYKWSGKRTNPGSAKNAFTYALKDGTNAANYDITTVFGTLKVTGSIPDTPTNPTGPTDTPTRGTTPVTPVPAATTTPVIPLTPAAPLAPAQTQEEEPVAEEIADDGTPLAAAEGTWSLFDLLATLATAIICVALLVGALRRDDENPEDDPDAAAVAATAEDDELNELKKRRRAMRIASLVPVAVAVVALLLTQDFSQPMAIFDQWSLLFGVVAAVQVGDAVLSRDKKEDPQDGNADPTAGGYAPAGA